MKKKNYSFNDKNMHLALKLQEKEQCVFVRKVVIKFYRNVKAFCKGDELELNLGKK